jgi:UDP-N-acetyl-D-galactosamine dehydrogenase
MAMEASRLEKSKLNCVPLPSRRLARRAECSHRWSQLSMRRTAVVNTSQSINCHHQSADDGAKAAQFAENAQRDVNISFVNELALIFDRLGIDTNEVIEAAGSKWNFLKYRPGLVGGHCISVDPYYLAYKAEQVGYHPAVILSGRRVNDGMGAFVANKLIKLMISK